jgi:muramidase (phage lysozyme)
MKQPEKKKSDELKEMRDFKLSRLNARIAEVQRAEDSRERKAETRYKIIFGACLLADLEAHPELRSAFEQSLKRTATGRDLELLKSKGWRL